MAIAPGDVTHEEGGPRSFAVFLQKVAEGDCHQQLSGELHTLMKEIIAQARAQCKAMSGSLTLTLNFVGEDNGALNVKYDVKRKSPKPRGAPSMFWIGKDGNVVDENPKQQRLPGLRDVSTNRRDVRDADEERQPAREA